jgi:hypothetical protein
MFRHGTDRKEINRSFPDIFRYVTQDEELPSPVASGAGIRCDILEVGYEDF